MISEEYPFAVEVETQPNPDASVIWIHGLGDDGYGWTSVAGSLHLPPQSRIRFVLPHASSMPIKIKNGVDMSAWYALDDLDLRNQGDVAGMRASREKISALIDRERGRGIDASRIVLAGFSQGGVMALHTGLCYPERLAGVVALSAYLMDVPGLLKELSPANRKVPVFMAHGTEDPVVLPEWAVSSRDILRAAGYPVDWHTYPMQHSTRSEELQEAGAFLARVIPPLAA